MPINNSLFGVWKIFKYNGVQYIVENSTEAVSQDAEQKHYIMGTAMPRVLSIKGAEAKLDITAPLLVCEKGLTRTGNLLNDPIRDGLTLVKTMSTDYMNPNLTATTAMIFRSIDFSVSADQGASYSVSAVGDYDELISEGANGSTGSGLSSESTTLPVGTVYRVASFYDFDVNIGGYVIGPSTGTYLRDLKININYNTESFSYVGQPDQRKYYGISSFEVSVSGTFIANQRYPLGASPGNWPYYSMPLQAPVNYGEGGHAIPSTGNFGITLRNNNGLDVLPTTSLNNQKFIFTSTSMQGSTGLLTTSFEGRLWAITNTQT